ncbi:hypothetical protein QCD85_06295 [Paenibacillus sp. PsM32]|uniref:hypothetical protein n=1 Tax=Paenibacillus sp. PsM32 TaxID=3030536 RepID=UPI00263B794E|nr:hypothetical protein [Paenibacillus sp. PsM32]MDN4617700.1 hypothetical protein [Paenibacillus sp. PsM32]
MPNEFFTAVEDYIYYIKYSISDIMYNQYMMTIGMCISTVIWIGLCYIVLRIKNAIILWLMIILSILYFTTGPVLALAFLWFPVLLIVVGTLTLLIILKLVFFSKQKPGIYNSQIHIKMYDLQQLVKKHNYIVEFDKYYKEYSLIRVLDKPYSNESEYIVLISAIPYESCSSQNCITKSYFNQYIQPYLNNNNLRL